MSSASNRGMSREPSNVDRRALLGWVAASALATGAGPLFARSSRASAGDVDSVARWIVATPRERVLARALREVRAGLPLADLRGATLVAAAREIRPNVATFNHAALVVTALGQLTDDRPPSEQLPLTLWGIDNFKEAQEKDSIVDWKLAPRDSGLPSEKTARAELIAALERWDPEAADAALVALVRSAPLASVLEIVSEYGMRSSANAGHKAIYAMVALRSLPIVGERWSEDVLRSCVASLLADGATTDAEPFEMSRELAKGGFEQHADAGASDTGVQHEVLALLRNHTPVDVPRALVEILAGKASTAAVWDALVMLAAEVAVEAPGVGPLHAFTSTNALHYLARHAPNQHVADLALLQAGAWVSRFRANVRHDHQDQAGVRIDELRPTTFDGDADKADARIARLLGEPAENRVGAPQRVLSASTNDADARALADDMLAVVRAIGDEVHDFKLAAAVAEESHVCGNAVRPCALAALAVNLPDPRRAARESRLRIADAIAVKR